MPETLTAGDVFDDLSIGDVIEVDQYVTPLQVTHDGRDVGMLGVEFLGTQTAATKSLIRNENSGRVYLIAGATDKGEVETIVRHD